MIPSRTFSSVVVLVALIVPGACRSQEVVYFGNLHSHTSYSDGSLTPEEAYTHARDVAGLDFLAITEHNHCWQGNCGSKIAGNNALYNGSGTTSLISTAGRFTVDGQFVAIYGQEFSSIGSGNHANVFEVGDVINTSAVPNGEWDDLLQVWLPAHPDASNQPALMLLNHPAAPSSRVDEEYGRDDIQPLTDWRAALDAHAQLINIINGPSHDNTVPGVPSESEFHRYLDLGFHLAPTADQDNHRTNWGSAADTRTGVIATELTKAAIMNALKARNVYATEDRNLRVIARVNGALMGTRFGGNAVPAAGSQLNIQISISDDDEPLIGYRIEVFTDAIGGAERADVVRIVNQQGDGNVNITGVTYPGGDWYLFFKIIQLHDDVEPGDDRVWTAPVWFEPSTTLPAPGGAVSVALTVDLVAETATITNIGSAGVDLQSWTLISIRGNQRFTFLNSVPLAPGESVTVTSGPSAPSGTGFIHWTNSRIWNNTGDRAELRDPGGVLRAEDE